MDYTPENLSNQLFKCPDVTGDSRFHRGCNPQSLMHAAKVVECEPERVGSLQVLPLLAEGVGESRHPAHTHTDGKILPFNVRCANTVRVRLAPYWLCYGLYHAGWRVSVFVIGWRSIDLDKLGKINPRAKAGMDCIEVGREAVRCDLELTRRGLVHLFSEGHGITRRSPSKVP